VEWELFFEGRAEGEEAERIEAEAWEEAEERCEEAARSLGAVGFSFEYEPAVEDVKPYYRSETYFVIFSLPSGVDLHRPILAFIYDPRMTALERVLVAKVEALAECA
jgi:hypothetical protein